jgi:hypothetical protein
MIFCSVNHSHTKESVTALGFYQNMVETAAEGSVLVEKVANDSLVAIYNRLRQHLKV